MTPGNAESRVGELAADPAVSARPRPPFLYYGGKQTVAARIVALFPDHEHYVEPFAGSLAVLLAKPPSRLETVNDLSGDLMTFWRVLRDQPDDLIRLAALTPHSRAEYESCYGDDSTASDVERARRVWVKLTQAHGGVGLQRRSGWKHAKSSNIGISFTQYLSAYVDRMPACAARLQKVSLESRDALDVIREYGQEADALLYVDPPYLGSTRTPERNYGHELRTEAEHGALAEVLHGARAAVFLSGYRSSLYDALYKDWHAAEFSSSTGNASPGCGKRTEVLWANVPLESAELTLWTEGAL